MHEGQPIVLELLASRRAVVHKNVLEAIQPDRTYELKDSRKVLQSWLAARYRRHALPTSLVDWLRSVFEYIETKRQTKFFWNLVLPDVL
jgi:hypothetical protein